MRTSENLMVKGIYICTVCRGMLDYKPCAHVIRYQMKLQFHNVKDCF